MEGFIAKQRQKLLEKNAKKLLNDKTRGSSKIGLGKPQPEPILKDLKNIDGSKKKKNDVSQTLNIVISSNRNESVD